MFCYIGKDCIQLILSYLQPQYGVNFFATSKESFVLTGLQNIYDYYQTVKQRNTSNLICISAYKFAHVQYPNILNIYDHSQKIKLYKIPDYTVNINEPIHSIQFFELSSLYVLTIFGNLYIIEDKLKKTYGFAKEHIGQGIQDIKFSYPTINKYTLKNNCLYNEKMLLATTCDDFAVAYRYINNLKKKHVFVLRQNKLYLFTGEYIEKYLEFEAHVYGNVKKVYNNDTNIYIVNGKNQLFGFGGNRYHQLQLPASNDTFHDVHDNGYICDNVKKVQVDILCVGILTFNNILYRVGYIDRSSLGRKRMRILNNIEDFSIKGNKLAVLQSGSKSIFFL